MNRGEKKRRPLWRGNYRAGLRGQVCDARFASSTRSNPRVSSRPTLPQRPNKLQFSRWNDRASALHKKLYAVSEVGRFRSPWRTTLLCKGSSAFTGARVHPYFSSLCVSLFQRNFREWNWEIRSIFFVVPFFFFFRSLVINVMDRRKRKEGKIVRVIKLHFFLIKIAVEERNWKQNLNEFWKLKRRCWIGDVVINIWILLAYFKYFCSMNYAFDLEKLAFRQSRDNYSFHKI